MANRIKTYQKQSRLKLRQLLKEHTRPMATFIGGLDVIDYYLPEQRTKLINAIIEWAKNVK